MSGVIIIGGRVCVCFCVCTCACICEDHRNCEFGITVDYSVFLR